jgi:nicotinamidase/pyrazinamidase
MEPHMKRNIELLIIDPQNDFCDLPVDWLASDVPSGEVINPALPVAGAHEDMLRLAELIAEGSSGISNITVTLDSHHRIDIAHPTFWKTGDGKDVGAFTQITAAQVRAGGYLPRAIDTLPRALAYLDELERRGRYTLMVWPVHCEIGSWGNNVHAAVKAAYNRWEEDRLGIVRMVTKGSNPWTENYSAVQAEVPDKDDPDTQLNTVLISKLDEADQIVIAGEASSHCVRATTEHIAEFLPSRKLDKLVLLTDCMSAVGGFEAQAKAFVDDMRRRGVVVTTSKDYLPALVANA